MNKEKLQAELDGLKLTLKNIKQTITVDWLNHNQSPTDEFEALNEFFAAVYDLQNKTVTQDRIETPQELTGTDILTEDQAEQIINDVNLDHGTAAVAELLFSFDYDAAENCCWYCYDNDKKQLFNACQYNVIEFVFDNIQTAING